MNKVYIVIFSLFLLGCDWDLGPSYSSTSETVYVDYFREACSDSSTDMCFRIRFDIDDEFVVSTISNSGFENFEWGKRYTAQIEIEYDSAGDDELYSFIGIEEEETIDSSVNDFVLSLNMSSQILLDNADNNWILAAEDGFSCIESDCILLTNAYAANEKVQLRFSAADDQLTLLEVLCSAAENDFASTCEGIDKTRWDIAYYQTDCGLFEPRLCLVYRDADDTDSDNSWSLLPFEITNFTAEWGIEYDIDVEVTSSAGVIRSAEWLEENSREDFSEDEFNVVMRTGVKGIEESSAGVITYDGIEFNCVLNDQCNLIDDAIDSATSSSERILALLTYSEVVDGTTQRVIKSITCDESSEDFKVDCADDNDEVVWIE